MINGDVVARRWPKAQNTAGKGKWTFKRLIDDDIVYSQNVKSVGIMCFYHENGNYVR